MSSHNKSSSVPASCDDFNDFFNSWLSRQQSFLDQLVNISNDDDHDNNDDDKVTLVKQVYSHYEEFYNEKSKVISKDIFQLFSHPWLTSLERAFLWVGGLFRPTVILNLTRNSVSNMVSEQEEKLKSLKTEVAWMERKLTDSHAEVQEGIASPEIAELMKNWRRLVNGEVSDFDNAVESIKESMVKVVNEADNLRRFAVVKAGEILSLDQTIQFLIILARHQLRIRAMGLEHDGQRDRARFNWLDFSFPKDNK